MQDVRNPESIDSANGIRSENWVRKIVDIIWNSTLFSRKSRCRFHRTSSLGRKKEVKRKNEQKARNKRQARKRSK